MWLRSGCFILLFVSMFVASHAQTKTFFNISKYERRWAFFHPFAACRLKKHQKEMYAVYKEVREARLLDAYASGGRLDAFRHVFAMAYFVRYVKPRKLRKLGRAHEKGNYEHFKKGIPEEGEVPDSLATVMDLKNNELGMALGCQFKKVSSEELKKIVIDEIKRGTAFILLRDSAGRYLDCSGKILEPAALLGKWQNEKCLVSSKP